MITYKNITDVEVLEQASENTKVLVNEGGELMQAPYSNFEDKMSNAEVLEKIPENAMALVNDGGKLKQVACGAFGGGVATAIWENNPDTGMICINMGFQEARNTMDSMPLSIVLRDSRNGASFHTIALAAEANDTDGDVPYIAAFFYADGELHPLYWTSYGIQEDFPGK